MNQESTTHFGKIRSFLCPIHLHEVKKILPMFFMLFLICVNYTILKNLKETLVITAKKSGAEAIPFIKVWAMLPAAVISTIIYNYLSNRFGRSRAFYIIIGFFLTYFICFTFLIYPMQEALQANKIANTLEGVLPFGFKGLISMIRNWIFTGFYVISELWGTQVLLVLFWGFANEITSISEASRFYGVLNVGSNCSSIFAGQLAIFLTLDRYNPALFFGKNAWEQTFTVLMGFVIMCTVIIMGIYFWMQKNVLNDPRYVPQEPASLTKKQKSKKLSFRESINYLAHSKYLLCIAAMVVSYNFVISSVEIIWKDRLSQLHPDPKAYSHYMSNLTSVMGLISTFAALGMSSIIRTLGWTYTAMITPIVLFITTFAFIFCLLAPESFSTFASAALQTSPLALAVFFGSLQNCFTKAAKYSLFDTTKEMSFIPLASEYKLKGKAAIDGIGSRMGKSGGSLIHQGLLICFGTFSASTPYVGAILLGAITCWILAVRSLGVQFNALTKGALNNGSDSEKKETH